MDLLKTLTIAASGLRAQAGRMRIISENIANADFDAADGRAPTRIAEKSRPFAASLTVRSTLSSSSSARYKPTAPHFA